RDWSSDVCSSDLIPLLTFFLNFTWRDAIFTTCFFLFPFLRFLVRWVCTDDGKNIVRNLCNLYRSQVRFPRYHSFFRHSVFDGSENITYFSTMEPVFVG